MGRRIGLLGGTFDPPHLGHLWVAETAREQLALDQMLFLPVGEPPHKQDRSVTAVAHRLAMTKLAIATNPDFVLDTTDMDRPLPHTTHTLLPLLHQAYPDSQLWFLIGADSLHDFPTWEQPEQIITQCRLAVYPRPGVMIDWPKLETAVPGIETAVDLIKGPIMSISSSGIRNWRRQGHSVCYLVTTDVLNYIEANKLYTKEPGISETSGS
ncbi:MAG: nicotinate (nicotinamide) nucleotide adenylyltransferase [Ardenticatenaceae bacterium]|nr:nicotinate (nicotinamide) nucleotide adenylyltransferase [Ardenticatenaceae bacterium]